MNLEETPAEIFETFWENSKFSEVTIGEFQKRIEEYTGMEHEIPALQFPGPDNLLPMPKDSLAGQMRRRQSGRKFSDKLLTKKQLGSILAAFARNNSGGRTFPSAGATYSLEVFCLLNRYEGDLNHTACYYNPDNHSLSVVGSIPHWEEYSQLINVDLGGTTPAALFVFVLFPSRATVKYGERGGRFALIEVGQAAQNLALRLVQEKLIGVEIGGLLDDKILSLIGLGDTAAGTALGYAVGRE